MSSEASDFSVAMRQRNNPAPYWAFFTKEEAAFWSFIDPSREDFQTQVASPQHAEHPHTKPFSWHRG